MNTRDAIHRQPIREAAAWTAASLGPDPKARVTRDLTVAELAAMDEFLARTRSRAAWGIAAADAPALKPVADDIKAALSQGAGMIVVRGMDRGRLSKEDCERVFWALGTFMGDATMQNPK